MNYPSPRTPGSTPNYEWEYSRMSSATPTPSPRPNWLDSTPQRRPATRAAHSRVNSYSQPSAFSPRPPRDSPRYNSSGEYATVDGASYSADPAFAGFQSPQSYYPPPPARAPTSHSHVRRSSASVPQRPSTVRPTAQTRPAANTRERVKLPPPRTATELDAKHHDIPRGYSLKNWDPNEEPILLLGSVFDANSLGKWIFDWTVYRMGAQHPISDMAGELWLLLIQLFGDIKKADDVLGYTRNEDNREILADFIESGGRLVTKMESLLKACEQPMLKASKKKGGLGTNSGVEFVDTLFGRDRELERTEKFMQALRTFKLRFDANCRGILKSPNK